MEMLLWVYWDAQPTLHAISLDALMGAKSGETIKQRGEIKGMTIHVLLDIGSTHSFINTKALQNVGLIATEIDHEMGMEIATGQHMISSPCCQDARIWHSNDLVLGDLFALDIGDVVLGCDWMKSMGSHMVVFRASMRMRMWRISSCILILFSFLDSSSLV